MCVPSTTTPAGKLAPVMKLWFTPVPSRFAWPIVPFVPLFDQQIPFPCACRRVQGGMARRWRRSTLAGKRSRGPRCFRGPVVLPTARTRVDSPAPKVDGAPFARSGLTNPTVALRPRPAFRPRLTFLRQTQTPAAQSPHTLHELLRRNGTALPDQPRKQRGFVFLGEGASLARDQNASVCVHLESPFERV